MSGAPLDDDLDPETASHHGGIADLAASALAAIMSGDTPTGCGSTSCIIAPARVGVGVCSCLNELTPALRVPLRAVVARLRAESTVLASVVEALEDSARPEEPPVDAARRFRADVERLTEQVRKLQRDLCQAWGLDELGQRFPGQAARDRAARAVAKRQAWDCYPEDSTTDEPAPAEPDSPEVAWSALRIAAARLGSVTVRGAGVDLHAAVDMALGEARGEPICARCKDTGTTRSVSVDMSGNPGPPSRCPYCTVEAASVECTTCGPDGRFRIGTSTDICGDCLGTKRIPPTNDGGPGGDQ